jgi:hypothetical protein
MSLGWTYSGLSPFFRVKFWKKEFVGSGVESSAGEKKREGSGRTVDWIWGKRNGRRRSVRGGGGSDMTGVSSDGSTDGGGVVVEKYKCPKIRNNRFSSSVTKLHYLKGLTTKSRRKMKTI